MSLMPMDEVYRCNAGHGKHLAQLSADARPGCVMVIVHGFLAREGIANPAKLLIDPCARQIDGGS